MVYAVTVRRTSSFPEERRAPVPPIPRVSASDGISDDLRLPEWVADRDLDRGVFADLLITGRALVACGVGGLAPICRFNRPPPPRACVSGRAGAAMGRAIVGEPCGRRRRLPVVMVVQLSARIVIIV